MRTVLLIRLLVLSLAVSRLDAYPNPLRAFALTFFFPFTLPEQKDELFEEKLV